jgi:hypothetical protein
MAVRRQNKRQRRKARERAHDLRDRYREADLPLHNGLAIASFEDAYAPAAYINADGTLDARARLRQARPADASVAEGAPGWEPPRRPQVRAFVALKDDPFGRQYARGQIDRAQFEGGRCYQLLTDAAVIGSIQSLDPGKIVVSGGHVPEMITERRLRAIKKLREVDEHLVQRYGAEGLAITKAILVDRKSQEQTAREFGADNVRDRRSVGWLFRRCLDCLAYRLGYVSGAGARLQRLRKPPPPEPENDPARMARPNSAIRHCAKGGLCEAAVMQFPGRKV